MQSGIFGQTPKPYYRIWSASMTLPAHNPEIERGNVHVRAISFPEFQIDGQTGELFTETARVMLPPRLTELLMAIAERPGQIVTREELYRRLWKGSCAEYRIGLDTAMKSLRKALSRAAVHGVVIETLPRRGYRLVLESRADLEQSPTQHRYDPN